EAIRHAARKARGRAALSCASARLANVSHALCHAGCFDACIAGSKRAMTGNSIAKILLGLFFVALIATPFAIKKMTAREAASDTPGERAAALARHGLYLEDVAHAAGIDFVHQAATFDPKLAHIMPEIASMGAAVSIV